MLGLACLSNMIFMLRRTIRKWLSIIKRTCETSPQRMEQAYL